MSWKSVVLDCVCCNWGTIIWQWREPYGRSCFPRWKNEPTLPMDRGIDPFYGAVLRNGNGVEFCSEVQSPHLEREKSGKGVFLLSFSASSEILPCFFSDTFLRFSMEGAGGGNENTASPLRETVGACAGNGDFCFFTSSSTN